MLKPIAGCQSDTLNNVLANQALSLLWRQPGASDEDKSKQVQAALAAMMEFKPQDAIEGMMATQAVGCTQRASSACDAR